MELKKNGQKRMEARQPASDVFLRFFYFFPPGFFCDFLFNAAGFALSQPSIEKAKLSLIKGPLNRHFGSRDFLELRQILSRQLQGLISVLGLEAFFGNVRTKEL